ncbi:tubulin polyglutamylase ttll6 [Folsomia candida]|uniref:tubulin polyglutamylase ttll6 n=1 Tax=Folsomia candida TaxID=158441 RepID=UPI0016051893|nr:tubulin polyglutamylase ttll6 [Folsomia candida]
MSKRYELVEVPEDTAWNVYWTDYSVSLERAVEMRRFQIVNHFPGMNEICRKDLLARNLNRMKRVFPEEYNIYPMTWCLPADNNELQAYSSSRRGKTYICKPDMGCQGRGIFLVKNIKDVNPLGRIVCQIYIQKPFLIDHLKFDLRIYVLITSCDPLRIWVFEEGLARFATAKYRLPTHNNTENSYMHLTNYAVNKFSRDFVVDEDTGTKRKLTNVMNWLAQRGYDVETLEKEINDVIIKTILSAQPTLKHHYRTCFPHHDICSACFEILGFDVLIDHKLKPFVIEVNHSPSFHTDTALDREIKESLLKDTFAMLNFKVLDRGMIEREDRRRVQQRITNMLSEANAGTKKEVVKKEVTKKGGNNSSTTTATPTSTRFPHPGRGGKKDESSEQTAKDKKERRKEDYDELAFQWELDNCGRYRLVYPTDDSAKYDKFLAQNQVSLYQDTAASQARASLTKQKIEEYNVKKQIEEQKRVGSIGSNVTTITSSSAGIIVNQVKESHSKEKVRPESSGKSGGYEPMKKSNSNTKPVHSSFLPTNPSNGSSHRGFTLSHIVSKDECDRVRGLIQRGLLIRSLGIELQAYQLLCKVGGLKKMEHDEFRRKHGFVLPNTGGLVTGFNNSSSRPHSNSTIPPKFYMKLNQFSVDTSGSSNLNDNSHSNNFTARTQGNTQAMAHNFGNFIRRERATTSHSYRL